MVDVTIAPNPSLAEILGRHPRVGTVSQASGPALSWTHDDRYRVVSVADRVAGLKGLVEIVDNNPLVCADHFSVPSPASTLALIALAPISRAGLIAEVPTLLTNAETSEDDLWLYLSTVGWEEGCTAATHPQDLGGVLAATVIAAIATPEDLHELDDLYEEAYGRSFFIRDIGPSEWHVQAVLGKPWAVYNLRIAPGDDRTLLTVQVMADQNGKCGAAQLVHAFNVMAGFEESLGF